MTIASWKKHLAAVEVAELAPQGRRDRRGEQVRRHHPREVVEAVQVAGDGRQRRRHDGLVERREEHPHHEGAEDDEDAGGARPGEASCSTGGAEAAVTSVATCTVHVHRGAGRRSVPSSRAKVARSDADHPSRRDATQRRFAAVSRRGSRARRREPDAVRAPVVRIGVARDEAQPLELLDLAGDRRRVDAEPVRERGHAQGAVGARLELAQQRRAGAVEHGRRRRAGAVRGAGPGSPTSRWRTAPPRGARRPPPRCAAVPRGE